MDHADLKKVATSTPLRRGRRFAVDAACCCCDCRAAMLLGSAAARVLAIAAAIVALARVPNDGTGCGERG